MYIKEKRSDKSSALRVYKEYTKEAQRLKPKGKGQKQKTSPTLTQSLINQSKKLTSEEGLKTIDTLTQDQRLHAKEFFNLSSESSSLPNAKPFYEFSLQTPHATQEEFLSLNKRESKPHQRRRKEDSTEPESLHNEVKSDPPSLLQRDIENTYLRPSAPSFEVVPKLRLYPKKLPKQRKPPYEAHLPSKYYHQGTKKNLRAPKQNKET